MEIFDDARSCKRQKSSAIVLRNCTVPDEGQVSPDTCRSWHIITLL